MIAAQQYYIEFGNAFDPERLFSLLPNYIPDYCLQVKKIFMTFLRNFATEQGGLVFVQIINYVFE